jgi:hypothetical protein
LILIQNYAKVRPVAAKPKALMQTHIEPSIARKLDALARAAGNTRAGYLRLLIELHVRAITPRLLRSLAKTLPNILPEDPA